MALSLRLSCPDRIMAVDSMSIHIRKIPARDGMSPESPVLTGRAKTPAPSKGKHRSPAISNRWKAKSLCLKTGSVAGQFPRSSSRPVKKGSTSVWQKVRKKHLTMICSNQKSIWKIYHNMCQNEIYFGKNFWAIRLLYRAQYFE